LTFDHSLTASVGLPTETSKTGPQPC